MYVCTVDVLLYLTSAYCKLSFTCIYYLGALPACRRRLRVRVCGLVLAGRAAADGEVYAANGRLQTLHPALLPIPASIFQGTLCCFQFFAGVVLNCIFPKYKSALGNDYPTCISLEFFFGPQILKWELKKVLT